MSQVDPDQTGAHAHYAGSDRRKPDKAHQALQRQIDALKSAHATSIEQLREFIHKEMDAVLKAIGENTDLTTKAEARLDKKIDTQIAETRDIVHAYGRVQMVGRFIEWWKKLGTWALDHWKPLLICAVGIRVALKGGNFAETWGQLMKFIKD